MRLQARIASLRFPRSLSSGLIAAAIFFLLQGQAKLEANERIIEAMAHEMRALALENLPSLRCSDGKSCAPATESELKHPPISVEDTRRAMSIGLVSGIAEKCGLDWNKNFFAPLMRHFRYQVRMNERQLALIAFVHGVQQSRAFKSATNDICTPAMKERLSNSVAR
jgi:hypothetical protein